MNKNKIYTKLLLPVLALPIAIGAFANSTSANADAIIHHTDKVESPEEFAKSTGTTVEGNEADYKAEQKVENGETIKSHKHKSSEQKKNVKQHYYRSYDLKNIKRNKKQIIIKKNLFAHKNFKFAAKGKKVKLIKGQKFNVSKVVKYGKTTRLMLTNHTYVTGNTRFVKLIK